MDASRAAGETVKAAISAATVSRWRPVERLHRCPGSEQRLIDNGPWLNSAILDGPDVEGHSDRAKDWGECMLRCCFYAETVSHLHLLSDSRPRWGKGEVIISALRRQAMSVSLRPFSMIISP